MAKDKLAAIKAAIAAAKAAEQTAQNNIATLEATIATNTAAAEAAAAAGEMSDYVDAREAISEAEIQIDFYKSQLSQINTDADISALASSWASDIAAYNSSMASLKSAFKTAETALWTKMYEIMELQNEALSLRLEYADVFHLPASRLDLDSLLPMTCFDGPTNLHFVGKGWPILAALFADEIAPEGLWDAASAIICDCSPAELPN